MKLSQLLTDCKIRTSSGDLDTEILGLAYDSRDVARGSLFIAIRGTRMEKGMKGARYTVIPDRREAIRAALADHRHDLIAFRRSGSSTRVAR